MDLPQTKHDQPPNPADPNLTNSHGMTQQPKSGSISLHDHSLRQNAHDLRNCLNVIRSAAYLLRRKLLAAGGQHVDLVDMIEDSVKNAELIAVELSRTAVLPEAQPPSGKAGQSDG
jgi:hypothetical protein